jgi:hypothetical protein
VRHSSFVTHHISSPPQQYHPQSTKTIPESHKSPLLRLPAELRAFAPTRQDPYCHLRFSLSTAIPLRHFAALPPLSQVCSQIRAETKALPYVLNIFALEVELMNDFDAALPEYALSIIKRFAVRTTNRRVPHLLELQFHRSHRILDGFARLSALGEIFLPNYVMPALSVEKWREIRGVTRNGAATHCISVYLVPDLSRKKQERRFGLIIVAVDRKVSIPLYESGMYKLSGSQDPRRFLSQHYRHDFVCTRYQFDFRDSFGC